MNEKIENTIEINPRREVEDDFIQQKLKMVAPKVAEHDQELNQLRFNLG